MTKDSLLSLAYWEALRQLAEPFELMKFTLTYEDDLPSTGNHPKPVYVSRIRDAFHDQLADLWDSHIVLRQLARTARTSFRGTFLVANEFSPPHLPEYNEPIQPLLPGQTDFVAPIEVPNSAAYIPLIRESLYLACGLDILFLRHEDPGALVLQGGDLDGRLKTLFDALRMPTEAEVRASGGVTVNPCYCLLQSDSLISDLSVKTGRLLGLATKKAHAVRLTIDVTVKVLRVMEQNQCLTEAVEELMPILVDAAQRATSEWARSIFVPASFFNREPQEVRKVAMSPSRPTEPGELVRIYWDFADAGAGTLPQTIARLVLVRLEPLRVGGRKLITEQFAEGIIIRRSDEREFGGSHVRS